jgi:hypothetical protein
LPRNQKFSPFVFNKFFDSIRDLTVRGIVRCRLGEESGRVISILFAMRARRDTLKRYAVFRIKAVEFLDMTAVWQAFSRREILPFTPVGRTYDDFFWSIRTPVLSWFGLFVDKKGMNVIELWKELFPDQRDHIETIWLEIEPTWVTLKAFRDCAGFHADKPLRFFRARGDIIAHAGEVQSALEKFETLFRKLLKLEGQLTDLGEVVDELLDELDRNQIKHEARDLFRKRYMFPL